MLDRLVARLFDLVFRKELQGLHHRMEQFEAEVREFRKRQAGFERAFGALKVGADSTAPDGSWVCIGYRLGDRDYVNFYDFGDRNVGALRAFLEDFRKAGAAVLVKGPFNRSKRAPQGKED